MTGYGVVILNSQMSVLTLKSGRSAVNRATDLDVSQSQAGMKLQDGQHLQHRCSLVMKAVDFPKNFRRNFARYVAVKFHQMGHPLICKGSKFIVRFQSSSSFDANTGRYTAAKSGVYQV